MDETSELVREQRGLIQVLRLNRPEARNSLTPSLIVELARAFAEAETDEGTRAVVITGTGDRAFCAGMDLRGFTEEGDAMSPGDAEHYRSYQRFIRGEIGVPVVGAANGTAVAGGLELLLGCDLVVASSAARFGLPEVRRGLLAAGGGTFIGTRIPLAVALELALTGDPIDAARAYELGLVNRVVEPGEVLDDAVALAERIAANGPLAVQATKELVRLAASDVPGAWSRLEHWQPKVFASADAREGALAFVEKRDPVWSGR